MSPSETRDDTDPYTDDPFFKFIPDPDWNACVGSQGDEENYIEGYIEAATELVGAIIDKQMFGKRDTLVLPILYNARHALELALKYATNRFVKAELMQSKGPPDHNIEEYWVGLQAARIGDEQIKKTLDELKPFVDSLSRIDKDGQELRYHTNQSNAPSLATYSLVNLALVRESIAKLASLISTLRNRAEAYISERATGTCTPHCSRRDLLTIAQTVPRRDSWNSELFDQQKAALKARYGLSNGQYSKALGVIQSARETKALLGIESDLLYLTDEDIVRVAEQWRRLHPIRVGDGSRPIVNAFDDQEIEEMVQYMDDKREVVAAVEGRLSVQKLAELKSIFSLGRGDYYSEYFNKKVESASNALSKQDSVREDIGYLVSKTNFLACLKQASQKLGRLSLALRLEGV